MKDALSDAAQHEEVNTLMRIEVNALLTEVNTLLKIKVNTLLTELYLARAD